MPLQPGRRLGPYEILATLRAGGMGEVYRALDPRLNREVAIKVLPADRIADAERRRRFVTEAKAASALNHPHIVTIHEFASADGIDFLVMEYVRGRSLDEAIPRHGLRLGETLRIAIAVSDVLAAAHAHGILHRDLKPANVAIGQDGAVKVLDFGLAKLVDDGAEPSGPEEGTRSLAPHTEPGRVVGTLVYMAPEQAAGGTTDARSDIFSFGAVLYEMATGQRAFPGTSSEETLAQVLQAKPTPPSTIVPDLPPDLERVILRCLRKDPARRFQTMADLKVDLLEIKDASDSGTTPSRGVPAPRPKRRWVMTLAAAVLAVALYFGFKHFFQPPAASTRDAPMRVVPLTTLSGSESWPEFSPDGTQVAFTWDGGVVGAKDQVYIMLVGGGGSRQITSDPRHSYMAPSWSPDGRQIAVGRCGSEQCELRLISPLGGQDTKFNDSRLVGKPAWSPDGKFLAAALAPSTVVQGTGIFLLPVAGGAVRRLTQPAARGFDFSPVFSRDGHSLAYVSCLDGNGLGCDVYLAALTPTLETSGAPQRVTHNAGMVRELAWIHDGTALIYTSWLAAVPMLSRVSVNVAGQPQRVEVAGFGASHPATSPVGDRLAFTHETSNVDVYKLTAGRPPQPIVTSSFSDTQPALSPDGRRIAFCTSRSMEALEVWVSSADGSGAQQLTHGPGSWQCSPSWSPDGKTIAFDSQGADAHWHIWTIDAEGGTPTQLTTGPGSDQNVPTWSRDGARVYFNAGGGIWKVRASDRHAEQVTKDADYAAESADGKELLYQGRTETGEGPVVAMPLGGGAPHQVVPCAWNDAFADLVHGFYYAACGAGSSRQLHVLDRRTGNDKVLLTLEAWDGGVWGLPVSPDGTSVYYPKNVSPHSDDLMLIENFK